MAAPSFLKVGTQAMVQHFLYSAESGVKSSMFMCKLKYCIFKIYRNGKKKEPIKVILQRFKSEFALTMRTY